MPGLRRLEIDLKEKCNRLEESMTFSDTILLDLKDGGLHMFLQVVNEECCTLKVGSSDHNGAV